MKEEADEKEISVRAYNVIYKLVDDVKKEINNKLPPLDAEEVIGMREKREGGGKEGETCSSDIVNLF